MTLVNKDTHLEFKLGSAVATTEFSFVASWFEANMFGGNKNTGESNGTTSVKLIEGPDQGDRPTLREARKISIKNVDTASNDVYVQYNDEATERPIYHCNLQPGSTLFYEEHRGWYVMDKFGSLVSTPSIPDEMIYFVTSGTDTYTGTTPKITAYYEGLTFKFKISNNNTGASTLNINGLGAKALVNFGATALSADELEAGTIYEATYDGTNFQISSTTDLIQNNV
jgi:hypothetical protein